MTDKHDPQSNQTVASFTATIQYGVLAIQGLMAGNGGAITALFALKDGAQLRQYAIPALIFATGFVAAIACAFFSYLSQSRFTQALFGEGHGKDAGMVLMYSAIAAGFASLGAMIVAGVLSFNIAILS